jgi:hypothetical protein
MSDDKKNDVGDLADLATIGAQIAELGVNLKALRAQRDVLNKQIEEAEAELMPLVVKHSKIIADITGTAMPTPTKRRKAASGNGSVADDGVPVANVAKNRIKDFIKTRAQDGMSALDISEALHVDAALVRECMNELMHPRGGGAPGK